MNTNKKRWSVILLMITGILFITVAGSIFVSNNWKLIPDLAKQISLGIFTVALFVVSHVLRKNEKLSITGRAMYYLSVVLLGFFTYFSLNPISDLLDLKQHRINLIRFGIADLLMMGAMVNLYIKKKRTVDLCVIYVMLNSLIVSILNGFEIGIHGVTGLFSVETILLAVVLVLMDKRCEENEVNHSRTCMIVLYIIQMCITSCNAFIAGIVDAKSFGYITTIWTLMFVSTLVLFLYKKNVFSRLMTNIWLLGLFCEVLYDVVTNFDTIPDYYLMEVICMIIGGLLVFTKILWYDVEVAKVTVSIITFILACIIYPILIMHNFFDEHIECVLTLGVSVLAILIASAISNSKKYLILSSVVLAIVAIYLTRSFWLSIAWWVYLLIVGVVCITIAILKEKKSVVDI